MADLDYIYSPYYGVEPFDPSTGGATLTGQNLVVTVWSVTSKGGNPFLVMGNLVQPASQNSNLLPARRAAGVQAMHSRYSAQMFITNEEQEGPGELQAPLLFVLNPPPELRQQWAGAVVFNGGDPTDLANYTVKKSLMGGYTWVVQVESGAEASQNIFFTPTDALIVWGSILDLGSYDGTSALPFPLLKTSGEDGQPPQLFDTTTVQGVQEMLAAVNNGDPFYVPLLVYVDFDDDIRLTITYPHSAARG